MYEMQQLIGCGFLALNSVYDIKHKRIWGKSVLLFGIVMAVIQIAKRENNMIDQLSAFLPGLILIIFAWIRPGMVGMGDGICLIIMGLAWSLWEIIVVCVYAFLLASGYGLVLICLKKASKNTRLPFVPFLFVGTLIESVKIWRLY